VVQTVHEVNDMANVFVEPDKQNGGYKATQAGRVIVRGETQAETGEKAHDLRPRDSVLAGRVRLVDDAPHPDKWRHLFGPKR